MQAPHAVLLCVVCRKCYHMSADMSGHSIESFALQTMNNSLICAGFWFLFFGVLCCLERQCACVTFDNGYWKTFDTDIKVMCLYPTLDAIQTPIMNQ